MLYIAYKYTRVGITHTHSLSLPPPPLSSYHDDGVDAAQAHDGIDVCADVHDVSQETKRVLAVLLELGMRTGGGGKGKRGKSKKRN